MSRRPSPVVPKQCKSCGNTLARRDRESPGKYQRRAYCNETCSTQHLRRKEFRTIGPRAAYVIEELEFLGGTDDPDRLATRLGYKNGRTLAEALRKFGRYDLAALFPHHTRTEVAA